MTAALVISLWISACIDGSLHGSPAVICSPEFQLPARYETVAACEGGRKKAVADWLVDMKRPPTNLDARIRSERCGPSEVTGDDI